MLSHPFSPREMAFMHTFRTVGFAIWIQVQHYARDVTPVSTLCVGIQESEVGYQMVLVIDGYSRGAWRGISNNWRGTHSTFPNTKEGTVFGGYSTSVRLPFCRFKAVGQ